MIERMTRAGHPIRHLNRYEFAACVRAAAEKYAGLIRDNGLRQAD